MKVYIVTDGCYSDYSIEKVFSNRPAAEEYKKWHNISNEIEEYDLFDEPFTTEEGVKVMFIRVQGMVYPEAVVDVHYEIRPDLINKDRSITSGAGIIEYRKAKVFSVYNYHYVSAEKWDEEKYKAKFTKALYDYAAVAKSMLADGANPNMINEALNKTIRNDIEEDS